MIGRTIGADQIQEGAKNHCQPSREKPCRVESKVLRHQKDAARGVHAAQHQQRPSENAVESLHGFGLSPKMAVPTRTQVEPSSMATSKSCDMPIESSFMETPGRSRLAIASRNSRILRKYGRESSGFSV